MINQILPDSQHWTFSCLKDIFPLYLRRNSRERLWPHTLLIFFFVLCSSDMKTSQPCYHVFVELETDDGSRHVQTVTKAQRKMVSSAQIIHIILESILIRLYGFRKFAHLKNEIFEVLVFKFSYVFVFLICFIPLCLFFHAMLLIFPFTAG